MGMCPISSLHYNAYLCYLTFILLQLYSRHVLSQVRNPAMPQGVQEKRRDRREASALQKASQMNLCVNIFTQTQKHVELAMSTLTGFLIFPAHTLMHNIR